MYHSVESKIKEFMNLKNKKIGVVGCGWLGLPLAKEFLSHKAEIHGTSRSEEKLNELKEQGITPHRLTFDSFGNQPWMKELDILILNIPPSDFKFIYAEKMAELASQLGASAKLIFVSSTSVYPDTNENVNEETKANGTNRSGPWVRQAEIVLEKQLGKQLTVIRMAGLVGGKRNPVRFMSGKSYPGGQTPVNLIHREDCIGLIFNVITKNYWGEILNGCAPDHPVKADYYTNVANEFKIAPPIFTDNKTSYKLVDGTKAVKDLGYSYKYSSPNEFPLN